jgi:hypothetical protein
MLHTLAMRMKAICERNNGSEVTDEALRVMAQALHDRMMNLLQRLLSIAHHRIKGVEGLGEVKQDENDQLLIKVSNTTKQLA